MSALRDIEKEIRTHWKNVPAAELSIDILSYLSKLPEEERRVLTLRNLARAIGDRSTLDQLAIAVNILVGSSDPLLDVHAFFVDESDVEYELSDEEFAEAQLTNEVVHPDTGVIIANASAHLVPFFAPTRRFDEAISGDK